MIEIRQSPLAEIFHHPYFDRLTDEYEFECSDPEVGPKNLQENLYAALENAGSLRCFGVWDGAELVGYAFLLIYTLPHYGKKIAATESIFVRLGWRCTGAGAMLTTHLEQHAKAEGCQEFSCSARVGSQFEKVLAHKKSYRKMSVVYRKRLT